MTQPEMRTSEPATVAAVAFRRGSRVRSEPRNLAQAYAMQEEECEHLGPIGGWRICHPEAEVELACAPLPLASIRLSPTRVDVDGEQMARLSPQICFRLQRSLPDYDAPYSREQVLAAIGSVHPAVAILYSNGTGRHASDILSAIADSCDHQYLICGPAAPAWPEIDIFHIPLTVLQNDRGVPARPANLTSAGVIRWWKKQGLLRAGAALPVAPVNAGGIEDPIMAVQWLANEGSRWAGGLMVGQWVTADLGVDDIRLPAGAPARIVLGGVGAVSLQFT